jgi:Na+/proline symporter
VKLEVINRRYRLLAVAVFCMSAGAVIGVRGWAFIKGGGAIVENPVVRVCGIVLFLIGVDALVSFLREK